MKCLPLVLLLCVAASRGAQMACSPAALSDAAKQVHSIREGLKRVQVGEMDITVPVAARDQLMQLKDALSNAADAALSCAGPAVDSVELQNKLAETLKANPPEPDEDMVYATADHRFEEAFGSYGHNMRVRVSRPANAAALLQVEFSVNIECGNDHMLLVYGLQNGVWNREMRWQASSLKDISDAFGDFFLSAVMSPPEGGDSRPRVVVAHGTPWCTSRFSGFKIDVLSPTSDPNSPKVLWHSERGYSRGDFKTRLRSSGDTFELRVNASCMDIHSYERHVIYRYRVDDQQNVHRIEPIATNARGFVEEWLSAPWNESLAFLAQDAAPALRLVHDQFAHPDKPDTEFVMHSYGPVRACSTPEVFQVQINSKLDKIVPGKPGGESKSLPAYYFHVREIRDGYLMISASMEPDPACGGPNLMPAGSD
jgi:hypothetical protein